jgi:hypothetical protein
MEPVPKWHAGAGAINHKLTVTKHYRGCRNCGIPLPHYRPVPGGKKHNRGTI